MRDYDVSRNKYYEVKTLRQHNKNYSKVMQQMKKYDLSIITDYSKKKRVIRNIGRGGTKFSGSFYYGAWKVKYGWKQNGLVCYDPKLDKSKQKKLLRSKEKVKMVVLGSISIGLLIGSGGTMPVPVYI